MTTGPDLTLPRAVATPLSMAVHEPSMNALQYEALSNATRSIEIEWSTETRGVLACSWIEPNGPTVVAPTRIGFGSRRLGKVLTEQPGAKVTLTYAPEGLQVGMVIPHVEARRP